MREVISTCPVCEHELSVTRLHCRECGTTLEGEFSVGRFSRLTRDQMRVLESFLRSRGNLREMERDLGLSYPTVRSRVDALVRSLGYMPAEAARVAEVEPGDRDSAPSAERRRILEALARHEISAEDAAAALRRVNTNRSATADPLPSAAEGAPAPPSTGGDTPPPAADARVAPAGQEEQP